MSLTFSLILVFVICCLIWVGTDSSFWGFLAALSLILAIGSCSTTTETSDDEDPQIVEAENSDIEKVPHPEEARLYTDPVYGCEYIVDPGTGITPRLNSDGNPVCPDIEENNF